MSIYYSHSQLGGRVCRFTTHIVRSQVGYVDLLVELTLGLGDGGQPVVDGEYERALGLGQVVLLERLALQWRLTQH